MKEKLIRFLLTILKIFLIIVAVLVLFSTTKGNAQIYYGELTKIQYNTIVSGNSFYPAKVLLKDGRVYEGFVARFPESNAIRFKETMDSKVVHTLTERHVKGFKYGLEKYSYPTFVYKDLDLRKNRIKIRPVEVVTNGDITIYTYTWVAIPDISYLPHSNAYYRLNLQFYLEKDGVLYIMNNFRKDIIPLIKDKKEVFIEYKKQKIRNGSDYKPFINIINLYNETHE